MKRTLPGLKLGILGGGQLGRMMAVEARRLGIVTICLDPALPCPAQGLADFCLQGSLQDPEAIRNLARASDVLTFEIEHVNTQVLRELEDLGTPIFPKPSVLALIQDKLLQKEFLAAKGLPVPAFTSLKAAEFEDFVPPRLPLVFKTRKGGYDGRGVRLLRRAEDCEDLGVQDGMIEEYVALRLELSVLLARSPSGETAVYDLIEMVFDGDASICDRVCAPARVPAEVAEEARKIALAAVTALDGVGVFAVEMFWAEDGRVLINEIAPRPHNSGHWTIEGAYCNQFEQHVRAVCGLPLGDPTTIRPSVTVNLLGAPDAQGLPSLSGIEAALALPGFKLHWYQKERLGPNRKMGHFTVSDASLENALARADQAQRLLKLETRSFQDTGNP